VKNLSGAKETTMDLKQQISKTELLEKLGAAGDTVSWALVSDIFGNKNALAKGGAPPAPTPSPTPIDKSALPPEVVAQITALEKKVEQAVGAVNLMVKATETAERADLVKRALVLKAAGFELDPEKVTKAEVEAFEKAKTQVIARLEKAGVLKQFGDPSQASGAGSGQFRELVAKSVFRRLGRDPLSTEEAARTRMHIYRAHPGLLSHVIEEERRERVA
jgi:hypothetical protein